MSKQSNALKKAFSKLIDDIFDNYDKYTEDEKQKIQTELLNLKVLNYILEKYDKKTYFDKLRDLFRNAAGKK